MTDPDAPPLDDIDAALLDDIDVARTRGAVMQQLFGVGPAPVTIEGFEIVGTAGSGAMGRVYVARDTRLDREVALKLIRPEPGAPEVEAARQRRLLQEARALARLSHPNIVEVLDVGEHLGDVYLVMELVVGQDLTQWLGDDVRSVDQVLDVFDQAAAGLGAAHAQGVIHRDFKPDNVRLGDDGRVRLVDFGLARGHVPTTLETSAPTGPQGVATSIAGTPAYMAPELFYGTPANPASDQYAFAVSLHLALYGELFDGGSSSSRTDDRPPVPRWLAQVVERGLQQDPADRFESMQALRNALTAGRRSRRPWAAWLLGLGAVIVGGTVALAARPPADTPLCEASTPTLAGTWDAARRHQVLAAVPSEDRAAQILPVLDTLDAYAVEWEAMARDNCQATHVRGDQDAHALDLRSACLTERRHHLDAVAQVLEDADEHVYRRARSTVTALPHVSTCAQVGALRDERTDEGMGPEFDAMQKRLARAQVLYRAGRYAEVEALVEQDLPRARASSQPRLLSNWLYLEAALHQKHRDMDAARRSFEEAFFSRQPEQQPALATRCAVAVMKIHEIGGRPDAADTWRGHAQAAAKAAGDRANPNMALHRGLAWLAFRRGAFDEAIAEYRTTLAILAEHEREHPHGPEHRGSLLDDIATTQIEAGRLDEALDNARRAHALLREGLGPQHPDTGIALYNMAHIQARRGAVEQSTAYLRRLVPLWTRELGPEHELTVNALNGLAANQMQQGQLDDAAEAFGRLIEIAERTRPDDQVGLAVLLDNLARVERRRERYDEGTAVARRVLALLSAAQGPDHPRTGRAHSHLATMLRHQGSAHTALEHARDGLRILLASVGPDHEDTIRARRALAQILAEQGQRARALELLDEAETSARRALGDDHDLVQTVRASRDEIQRSSR